MKNKKPITDSQGRIAHSRRISSAKADELASNILANATQSESQEATSIQPTYDEARIAMFEKYQRIFGTPNSVFYPACDIDASPLKAFPNSEVIFLDPDCSAARIMRSAQIPIFQQGIETYKRKHDLILLINPGFGASRALKNLAENGKVIASGGNNAANNLISENLPLLGELTIKPQGAVYTPKSSITRIVDNGFYVFAGKK